MNMKLTELQRRLMKTARQRHIKSRMHICLDVVLNRCADRLLLSKALKKQKLKKMSQRLFRIVAVIGYSCRKNVKQKNLGAYTSSVRSVTAVFTLETDNPSNTDNPP